MIGSVFLTALSILSCLFFYSGILFLKKSNQKQSFVAELPLTMWHLLFFLVTACSVVNMIGIPINLITVSILSLLCGGVCWYFNVKKGCQQFSFHKIDLAALIAISLLAGYFFIEQFGRSLYPLYETSDPSIHMRMALNLFDTGKMSGLLFSQFVNGMVIQAGSAFLPLTQYYKVFVLSDGFMFLLSGLTFYSVVIRLNNGKAHRIIAAVLSLIYILGYPLDNMVFGFVYLGMSVTIILMLLCLSNAYVSGEYNHTFCVLALMSACYCLAMSYSLFAPVVFISVFLTVTFHFIQQKKLISWRFVTENLKIFLLPCILAIYFFYFAQKGSQLSALAMEGYIYRELYSNFVFLIPPVLFAVYKCVRQKHLQSGVVFFCCFILYTVATFFLATRESMSSYYYYKIYYPLWAIAFYLAYLAVSMLEKKDFSAAVCYLLTFVVLFLGGVTKLDSKINNEYLLLNPHVASGQFYPIYYFNEQKVLGDDEAALRQVWESRIDLYDYMVKHCDPQEEPVPLADSWLWIYWYNSITNQHIKKIDDLPLAFEQVKSARYAVVNKTSDLYEAYSDYFDSQERIYENDHGYIIKNY